MSGPGRWAGLAGLVVLAGCTPSPVGQVPIAAPASPADGAEAPDDPAVAQAEAFGAATHAVVLHVPGTTACPLPDDVAAATGATVSGDATGDPATGCSYALDQGRTATLTFQARPLAEVRADLVAPTGPGQSVLVELDGSVAPGAYAVLAGAAAPEDEDVLVVPTDDGSGTWSIATVGFADGVPVVLVALADVAAATW